jgi:hypothetical protein
MKDYVVYVKQTFIWMWLHVENNRAPFTVRQWWATRGPREFSNTLYLPSHISMQGGFLYVIGVTRQNYLKFDKNIEVVTGFVHIACANILCWKLYSGRREKNIKQ